MTVTVDDVRLPASIERRAQGVRSFKTRVWENDSGFERRLAVMSAPRRSWVITSIPVKIDDDAAEDVNGITSQDIEQVVCMFEAARGMLYGFKYRPFNDHTCRREQGQLAYDADLGGFPLRKIYSNGIRSLYRRIYFIDPDVDPVVWVNGVETSVTISAQGVITGVAADADVEWEGDFLVPVRFDADDLDDEMSGDDRTMTLPTIRLRELVLE